MPHSLLLFCQQLAEWPTRLLYSTTGLHLACGNQMGFWLSCRLTFSLLQSAIQCIRGACSSCSHAAKSQTPPMDLVMSELELAHFFLHSPVLLFTCFSLNFIVGSLLIHFCLIIIHNIISPLIFLWFPPASSMPHFSTNK